MKFYIVLGCVVKCGFCIVLFYNCGSLSFMMCVDHIYRFTINNVPVRRMKYVLFCPLSGILRFGKIWQVEFTVPHGTACLVWMV